jgi:choline-sulfatase
MGLLRRPTAKIGILSTILILLGSGIAPRLVGSDQKIDSHPVLLITMDTVRADLLGCYGNPGFHSAVLDRFSQNTTLWTQAYTDVPLTLPSHVSILSMTPAQEHAILNNGMKVVPSESWLPLKLKKQGYRTAAVVSGFPLSGKFGLNRAFDSYDDRLDRQVKGYHSERTAGTTTDAPISWMKDGGKPLFLWVHYFDPHAPYEPPAPFSELFANQYEGECYSMIRQIARLIHAWTDFAGAASTIIMLSDHGEALGSHGEQTHGVFLYQETVRLVCMVKNPGFPVQKINDKSIAISNLGTQFSGVLYPDKISPRKSVLLQTVYPYERFRWSELKGILRDEWKYIIAPEKELYHLATDPGELRNIAHENPEMVAKLDAECRQLIETSHHPASMDMDVKTRNQLESLGYAAGYRNDRDPQALPDPKKMAHLLNPLEEALESMRIDDHANAKLKFELVLKDDPENPVANNNMGIIYLQQDIAKKAISYLEKARSAQPDDIQIMLNQALAYRKSGQLSQSESILREILRRDSSFGAAYLNLAVVLYLLERFPECRDALRDAIANDPDLKETPAFLELKRELHEKGYGESD